MVVYRHSFLVILCYENELDELKLDELKLDELKLDELDELDDT